MKKTKTVCVEYHGFLGKGPTKAQARAQAVAQAEAALNADYTPVYVSYGDYTAVGWCTPHGWISAFPVWEGKHEADPASWRGRTYYGPDVTRSSVERTIRYHIAQLALDPHTVHEAPVELLAHEEDRAKYARWAGWCRDYVGLEARYGETKARRILMGLEKEEEVCA